MLLVTKPKLIITAPSIQHFNGITLLYRHHSGSSDLICVFVSGGCVFLLIRSKWNEVTACAVMTGWFSKSQMQKIPRTYVRGIPLNGSLAVSYSRMAKPHYHRRNCVSLLSSKWSQVVPQRYCHQAKTVVVFNLSESDIKEFDHQCLRTLKRCIVKPHGQLV